MNNLPVPSQASREPFTPFAIKKQIFFFSGNVNTRNAFFKTQPQKCTDVLLIH